MYLLKFFNQWNWCQMLIFVFTDSSFMNSPPNCLLQTKMADFLISFRHRSSTPFHVSYYDWHVQPLLATKSSTEYWGVRFGTPPPKYIYIHFSPAYTRFQEFDSAHNRYSWLYTFCPPEGALTTEILQIRSSYWLLTFNFACLKKKNKSQQL